MRRAVLTRSESETQRAGAELANELFVKRPTFVRLSGDVGAGKTAFARGFIHAWSTLAGDTAAPNVTSPTYNIAKVYGQHAPIAHLDLYRLKHIDELSQIGFEHYFFEHSVCLVEWLEQIPEALSFAPPHAVHVKIEFEATDPNARKIEITLPE